MLNNIEELKEFFKDDKYAIFTGIKIDEVKEGYAKCHFEIEDKHLNADGVVMGGASYCIADFTFAIASNYLRERTVTLNSSINYLSPLVGKEAVCVAKVIKDGKHSCVGEVEVLDENGKQCCIAVFTGYRK